MQEVRAQNISSLTRGHSSTFFRDGPFKLIKSSSVESLSKSKKKESLRSCKRLELEGQVHRSKEEIMLLKRGNIFSEQVSKTTTNKQTPSAKAEPDEAAIVASAIVSKLQEHADPQKGQTEKREAEKAIVEGHSERNGCGVSTLRLKSTANHLNSKFCSDLHGVEPKDSRNEDRLKFKTSNLLGAQQRSNSKLSDLLHKADQLTAQQ